MSSEDLPTEIIGYIASVLTILSLIPQLVKIIVNKSAKKIHIIQNIDKKVPLEDIAKGQGMDFVDFLEELEAIVYSGTAVDLEYHIDELIDPEGAEEIYDFFKAKHFYSFRFFAINILIFGKYLCFEE